MSNDTVWTWVGAEVRTICLSKKRVIMTRGHPPSGCHLRQNAMTFSLRYPVFTDGCCVVNDITKRRKLSRKMLNEKIKISVRRSKK